MKHSYPFSHLELVPHLEVERSGGVSAATTIWGFATLSMTRAQASSSQPNKQLRCKTLKLDLRARKVAVANKIQSGNRLRPPLVLDTVAIELAAQRPNLS